MQNQVMLADKPSGVEAVPEFCHHVHEGFVQSTHLLLKKTAPLFDLSGLSASQVKNPISFKIPWLYQKPTGFRHHQRVQTQKELDLAAAVTATAAVRGRRYRPWPASQLTTDPDNVMR